MPAQHVLATARSAPARDSSCGQLLPDLGVGKAPATSWWR